MTYTDVLTCGSRNCSGRAASISDTGRLQCGDCRDFKEGTPTTFREIIRGFFR